MGKAKEKTRLAHIADVADDHQSVNLQIDADKEWIDHVTKNSDIFHGYGIGYWARGMELDAALGWLAYEHGDVRRPPQEVPADVLAKWRSGAALPRYWFRIDRATALRAQVEGVKLRGLDWYEGADGHFYDRIIQRAIFGDEKYG